MPQHSDDVHSRGEGEHEREGCSLSFGGEAAEEG
jgi:hypothetical protein